jgi:CRISPR/Cas system-associated exonuclease Cas4 (RecB family)
MTNAETKIEVVTSESEHWYPSPRKAGEYYPSVTTVLSVYPKGVGFNKYLAAQSSWESSQQILQDAGKRGTRVHQATQFLEEGSELLRDSYSLDEWEMLMGFVSWYQGAKPETIAVEYPLVSDKLKTGGTIDRVYMIDGKRTILDIKTSGAIYGNYWVQAATYAEMYEQATKTKVDQTAILRLTDRKKSRYEYKTMDRDEWKKEFKVFKAIQDIWNHLNPNAGPKILEIPLTLSLGVGAVT